MKLGRNGVSKGFFFDLLHKISSVDDQVAGDIHNVLCILASRCTYNELLRFVANTSMLSSDYKFLAGGCLSFIQNRMIPGVIPSVHRYVDSLSLMYRPRNGTGSYREALYHIFAPFQWGGWSLILLDAVLLCLCFAFFVWRYRPSNDRDEIMNWLVNSQDFPDIYQRLGWLMIPVGIIMFVTVLVLLYEIAVASFIFEGRSPLVTNMEQLAGLGLDKFAVTKGGASENIFRNTVEYEGANPPWTAVDDVPEMITSILNRSVDYAFNWRTNFEYWVCKHFRVRYHHVLPWKQRPSIRHIQETKASEFT